MLQRAWRLCAAATLGASEAVLHALGRRPPYAVLTVDLDGELNEQVWSNPLFGMPQRIDYLGLIAALRWAREDPAVRGVLLQCGNIHGGWAKLDELHRLVAGLRAAGKTVWAHLTHGGLREYLVACAAERVLLAPTATLDITGLSSEVTFVAGTLEKLGIEPDVIQMGRYKSAAETFTRQDMSAPHREMLDSLLGDLYDQIVAAVAASRRRPESDVRELLDGGPFIAGDALKLGLVDALAYADEADAGLRAACDQGPAIRMGDYAARRGRTIRRRVLRQARTTVGLLHITGTVKMGDSVPGADGASATGVVAATRDLAELRERPDIGAIVLRVASPGGSGLASDLLWREVTRARERKPVVVSFGDMAASGGYYVGVAGSSVIAGAGTITGSIGVLAGKAVLRGLYDRVGITKQLVTRGRHAALYSDYLPLGDEERELLRREAASFYDVFLDKVAAGRHLSRDAVAAVAEGRVWTGRQALALGLVDQIGGLEHALDEAKVLAGVTRETIVAIDRYPKPKRWWKLSLNLASPHAEIMARWSWFGGLYRERVWALLPFRFRFF
ncbi:signal peptide peptidase SppA [Candidatus Binatia bacterium]|nr:signal peptide peptidase SppA [Candidatus Binatia bacterium]